MNITFVYPDIIGDRKASDAMQPLAIAALAAHTPGRFTRRFFDDRLEKLDYGAPTDLVAISTMTFSAKRAYAISAEYRRRGVPVVLGGFHPTLLPDEAAEHADCVVTGDAEPIWTQVLHDFEGGALKRRYVGGVCTDPSRIHFDRSIFAGKRYRMMAPVQIGRGCRWSCDFCSVHAFYGSTVLRRSTEDIVDEIKRIKGRYLFFTDDNLIASLPELPELLAALTPLNKLWACQLSLEAAEDPSLLAALRGAGCLSVYVGMESLSEETLRRMRKGAGLRGQSSAEAVRAFHEAGFMVCGAFVFGYPQDTRENIKATLDFAIQNKLALCHFNPLFPFPKTRVYERLAAAKALRYQSWWNDPDYRYGMPTFDPEKMTGEELAAACQDARLEFNSLGCVFRRALPPGVNARTPAHLLAYLGANLINRREVLRKHGKKLGLP